MNKVNRNKYQISVLVLLGRHIPESEGYLRKLLEIANGQTERAELVAVMNNNGEDAKRYVEAFIDKTELKFILLDQKASASDCLRAGFEETSGETILVCGEYQQLDLESYRNIIQQMDDAVDVVVPYREERVDLRINQFQSNLFNRLLNAIASSSFKDISCNVKFFRRIVLEEIAVYGNMFRYLPVIASKYGFKTLEIPCKHLEERGKKGIYDVRTYVARLVDLFTLFFNIHYARKPLRFFSTVGAILFTLGALAIALVFLEKIFLGQPIGDRPILIIAMLLMVAGAQSGSAGLLGEVIIFCFGRKRTDYRIEKII